MWRLRTIASGLAVLLLLAACGSSGKSTDSNTGQSTQTVTHTVTTGTGTGTSTTSTTTSTKTATSAPSPSGPVPAAFRPESFTAIGDNTWWLLGSAPCKVKPCTSIVRTNNGGQSFVGIPAPRSSKVDQLRFASAEDGYAYGPQLWSTHDGGSSWKQISIGGDVDQLAAADGYVFAIVRSGSALTLKRSRDGSGDWSTLRALPQGPQSSLWVQGRTVIVTAMNGGGDAGPVLVSDDGGESLKQIGKTPQGLQCSLSAPPGNVSSVWAVCATGMLASVSVSTDGGAHFSTPAAKGVGNTGGNRVEFANSAMVAPFSASGAVAYSGQYIYRTTDGGASWRRVQGIPGSVTAFDYVGFTDATHGVLVGGQGKDAVYYTNDAGVSYHRIPISGS